MRAYLPPRATSSSWEPDSRIRPSSMKQIRSAFFTVDEPVRDHDDGAADEKPLHRCLHLGLRFGIERAGRLVEQQDRRVAQHGAGEGDALALAAGEAVPASPTMVS